MYPRRFLTKTVLVRRNIHKQAKVHNNTGIVILEYFESFRSTAFTINLLLFFFFHSEIMFYSFPVTQPLARYYICSFVSCEPVKCKEHSQSYLTNYSRFPWTELYFDSFVPAVEFVVGIHVLISYQQNVKT